MQEAFYANSRVESGAGYWNKKYTKNDHDFQGVWGHSRRFKGCSRLFTGYLMGRKWTVIMRKLFIMKGA